MKCVAPGSSLRTRLAPLTPDSATSMSKNAHKNVPLAQVIALRVASEDLSMELL